MHLTEVEQLYTEGREQEATMLQGAVDVGLLGGQQVPAGRTDPTDPIGQGRYFSVDQATGLRRTYSDAGITKYRVLGVLVFGFGLYQPLLWICYSMLLIGGLLLIHRIRSWEPEYEQAL